MILLGKYEELGPGMGFPSMKEFFAPEPYDGKERIVDYLMNHGTVCMVTASVVRDVFTGESAGYDKKFYEDGEFSWCNSLAHYVKKYNLRLPKEFENKVLN